MKISLWRCSYTVLTTFCLLGLTAASRPEGLANDIELRIGIVQRFGDDPKEELLLEPTEGDRLRLKFQKGNNQQQTLVTNKPVKLEVTMRPLTQPVVEERLVLGTYRTYETAEDSARNWRAKGIEVEITQPERWQVWAKRDVYSTPLLRRLLLESLQAAGKKKVFISTRVLQQVPQVSWVIDGKRYSRNYVEIDSDKNLIKVNEGKKPQNARLYAGRLQLQSNAYGTYTLVNEVPLETYLRGVVPYEIGTQAPKASMEAQAIIARTYALRNIHRFEADGYQLCADTHCQVYYGLKGATAVTDRAIATTRGMVLTYNDELVDALYSSTTGGITAAFSDVWNGDDRPYLQPVIDSPSNIWNLNGQTLADENNFQRFISLKKGFNESEWDLFRWRRETKLEDIAKGLQKFLKVKNSPYAKFKTIKGMKVVERSRSGRILKLAVDTDIGTFYLHKDEVRSAFAAPVSTLFYLQPLNKGKPGLWGYAFVGGGLGHGVGLSQTGAQHLAKLGWSNAKILEFYYPGTQIQVLNNTIKFTNSNSVHTTASLK
ncbi:SpoIID/LytB domain-containing protein [Fischerella thermalis]|uniref:SpoIID/LytB domain-containing protein n=4 Tax=Fischerella thermalis TaxID=372787 RepID=UPI000C80C25C|nr:SpoIID/LytB domain-containing protein [Fischerella thermalis]PLZ06004.1 amidase [Fischerella thermalis WC114]PLZ14853.1 amidase [Fischerella thermalis WC119]PLZ17868.1 amidase [Fischerella thermalis WC157]PLZ63559.1 amidase [Fischerella thermalis WC439]PLZ65355.1 amidase [Fischerella thermalis WC246]